MKLTYLDWQTTPVTKKPAKLRTDEVDVDILKQGYEHLMSGESPSGGWQRLNVDLPALRERDHAPEKGEKYGGCQSQEEARVDLHNQNLSIGTWDGTNLVSSQCTDGMHRLCIDVDKKCDVLISDFADAILVADPGEYQRYDHYTKKTVTTRNPAQPVTLKGNVFVVESSSVDHFHVYSDHGYTWGEYEKLLHELWDSEVLDAGYYYYSVERGFTAVRKPWVRKMGR